MLVSRTFPFGILCLTSTMLSAVCAGIFVPSAPLNALILSVLFGALIGGGDDVSRLALGKRPGSGATAAESLNQKNPDICIAKFSD